MNGADAWLQAQRSRVTAGFAAEGDFGRRSGGGNTSECEPEFDSEGSRTKEGGCDRGFWFVVG